MSDSKQINERVRQLASAIDFKVETGTDGKGGIAKGNDKAYVDNLALGLKEHGAWDKFQSALPKILDNDATTDAKVEQIVTLAGAQSEAIVRAKHAYDADFFAAAALALGEAAEVWRGDNTAKEMNVVTGKVTEVGRNKFSGVYKHEYSYPMPGTEGERATGYGQANVSLDAYGNRKAAEQMIAVRQHLKANASAGIAD